MQAGESKEYLLGVQAELTAETDPQLRAWYETETSLQPEYKTAIQLQDGLGRLATGMRTMAEQKRLDETIPNNHAIPETVFDETADTDEYLTEQQRKQKSVNAWVEDLTKHYDSEVSAARKQSKKSKRDKQEQIARKRFLRHFERYGDEEKHMVYDAEALGFALINLNEKRPQLAEVLVKSTESYLHQNGVDFAEDSSAFAQLIACSTVEHDVGKQFDRLFSAVYDKKLFLANQESASRLHAALAHAVLEEKYHTVPGFMRKAVETAYLANDIIKDKRDFYMAWSFYGTISLYGRNDVRTYVETNNARQVFYQATYAFLNTPKQLIEERDSYHDIKLAQSLLVSAAVIYGRDAIDSMKEQFEDEAVKHFAEVPQHYDGDELIDLISAESWMLEKSPADIPEKFRDAYLNDPLYKKRQEILAPRAVANDIIITNLTKAMETDAMPQIVHLPLSPGLTLSVASFNSSGANEAGDVPPSTEQDINSIVTYLLENHADKLSLDYITESGSHDRRKGWIAEALTLNGNKVVVLGILRPTVPADVHQSDPHMTLITSIGQEVITSAADVLALNESIDSIRNDIQERTNNYPGRRPIKFELPEIFRKRGMQSLEIRKHEDRRRLIVKAQHTEGEQEFIFDESIRFDAVSHHMVDEREDNTLWATFEKLVLQLYREWACRPVIETSEGIVTNDDRKSKVNLGFLRYLAEGQNPSPHQAKIFKLEQQGNLAQESLRRKPLDPKGQGRNSTYVRESYDPSKPPLEVYYDKSVLEI